MGLGAMGMGDTENGAWGLDVALGPLELTHCSIRTAAKDSRQQLQVQKKRQNRHHSVSHFLS